MSIMKNMVGIIQPSVKTYCEASKVPESSAQVLEDYLANEDVQEKLLKNTCPVLGITHKLYTTYWNWSRKRPSRSGFTFANRVDFWAISAKGMEAVPFLAIDGRIVFPMFIQGNSAHCIELGTKYKVVHPVEDIMPLFPRAVTPILNSNVRGIFKQIMDDVRRLDELRTKWIKDPSSCITPAEQEAVSELESGQYFVESTPNSPTPNWISAVKNSQQHVWDGKDISVKNDLVVEGTETNTFEESKEENETMTKATNVKSNLVETHKEALKQVGYLNGGRASNKLTKEAVRPLLNAMFKPTFMQKLGMKLFGLKNPIDEALKHPASDFFCAELANLIVEIRDVENPHVREVAKSGIVYSGMELSKLVPFEEAMDKVVEHLEQGAGSIVEKMKGKNK